MASLVDHFNEKFGMVTVLDGTFYEINPDGNDTPILEFDTLTVSNVSAEGEQKEIRGGQGADLLMQYDYGRTAEVELTDALISMESLQQLWGSKDPDTNFEYYGKTRFSGDTLPTEVDPASITKVVEVDSNGNHAEITPDGTADEYTFAAGNDYIVYHVSQSNEQTDKQLVLTSDDFPSTVHFVGETFVIDQRTGKRKLMQIDIPRFKLGSSFEFTLEAEGDASTFDFSGVALSNRGTLIKMQYLGDVE